MKRVKLILGIAIGLSMLIPTMAYAREGDSGYEGGIGAEQASYKTALTKKTFAYKEVCFVSGKPIVFNGTLIITKTLKKDVVTAKYDYNLTNLNIAGTLKRSLEYTTTNTMKDNGQTIETTVFSKKPTEVIKIDKNTYTLLSYDFTRSNIIDSKPTINYYAGNIRGKKTFKTTSGTATGTTVTTAAGGTVTVEEIGEFYGYDQYWGTTEIEKLNFVIQSSVKNGDNVDQWGGTASVSVSADTTKQLKYIENQPSQISFNGGYVQVQHNESEMKYHSEMPLFDAKGGPTHTITQTDNTLKLETFPSQTRLPVPNLTQLRGHWAENYIKILYSLEIFKGNDSIFKPEQYISRSEFAAAISQAAKTVPIDPALISKTATKATAASKTVQQQINSLFSDVTPQHLYFSQIDDVSKRGIMFGISNNLFAPGGSINVADAVAIFIRALGLESLAPNPVPVTTFRDNDSIPAFARKSVYVADKIGLIQADNKGNLNPKQKLTRAKAAEMLNNFINYMGEGIRKNYIDGTLNF